MMNHFFALLVILGLIFGAYTATQEAAALKESDARKEKWEALRAQMLEEIEALKKSAPERAAALSPKTPPFVDDSAGALYRSNGERITSETLTITAAEMRKARWERIKKKGEGLSRAAVDAPQLAVTLCIEYIGLMALWLGVMRTAERAGLIASLARLMAPFMRRLFPGVPSDHPAMSAMLLNMSANILGLDNAATPLGLAAMKELQKLNTRKNTATNAMIMFLAINTSSLMILPFSVVAFRAAGGSKNPQMFLIPAILATLCSTITAIVVTLILARFHPDLPPAAPQDSLSCESASLAPDQTISNGEPDKNHPASSPNSKNGGAA